MRNELTRYSSLVEDRWGEGGGRGGHGPPSDPVNDYLFAPLALNKYIFPFFFCNILQFS